jgi:glycosyltransferase involved in cell wall biosynthesis
MMKILVVHSELGVLRGGGENFTRNLFCSFAQLGHAVSAAFVADSKGQYPIMLPSHVTPIPLAGYWSRKLGQKTLSNLSRLMPHRMKIRAGWDRIQEAICWRTVEWHDQRFARRVGQEFEDRWEQFDAVYVHGSVMLASTIARHRPTILRLPGPVSPECAPVLKSIHAVCANGDALDQIRRFLGDHAIEIPVGLNGDVFKPGPTKVRDRLGWTGKHWIIGYVGRLAYIKGVDLLATAFKQIRQTLPHARLLVIGAGEEEGKLRNQLCSELDEGIVHVETDVPHDLLAEWFRAMDLFIMPSRYENYSNAALEALACGVPFLVSGVGGNKHLLETQGGWTFSPGSAASLAEVIYSLVSNPALAKDRGAFGGDQVRRLYNWNSSAKRLEDIFRHISTRTFDLCKL